MNNDIKRVILEIKEEASMIQGKIWDPSDESIIFCALCLYLSELRGISDDGKMEIKIIKKA